MSDSTNIPSNAINRGDISKDEKKEDLGRKINTKDKYYKHEKNEKGKNQNDLPRVDKDVSREKH